VTDEKGHYTLTASNDRPGAVIGKHNVLVYQGRAAAPGEEAQDPNADRTALAKNPPIPPVYTMTLRTPLQVEVTPDKHTYDLNLTRSAR
jgi:hypothetical protein